MMTPMLVSRRRRVFADLGLFYAAAIWGATFFLVKGALSDVDPVVLVGYRFSLAGLLVGIYAVVSGRDLGAHLGRGIYLGVILWLLYVPQTIGLGITTASNSGFITGLFVVFVPLFLRTVFKGRPTIMELAASGVALIGLWVLTGGLVDMNAGDLLTLVAAITYALHVLYSDRYMKGGLDPYVICCQQFLLVGMLSLLAAAVLNLPFTVRSNAALATIVFLALFPSLSAFVIQMLAQRIAPPLRVSLIFALEPVFAAAFAWTLGGELLVPRRAAGGLLIACALMLSGLPTPRILRPRQNQ
jgi:drug/metabolite transporter (DMT)-like permease